MEQKDYTVHFDREDIEIHSRISSWEFYQALFTLANIPVLAHWELPNNYWPSTLIIHRAQNPWWLVETPWGLLRFGRRKRVWHLDWENTKFRGLITDDDTTKEDTMVHVWTDEKFLEYLKKLKSELDAMTKAAASDTQPLPE